MKEEISNLKETLAVTEKDKELSASDYNSQLIRLKEDYERKLKEAEDKRDENEEISQKAERKIIEIQANCDKEKALLNQKIEHFSKQIEDFGKREKEANQEIKSQLKEQSM